MLGKKNKKIREEQNMTLNDLSNKINMSISFLSDIENERSRPSLNNLLVIAEGLETNISYLLGEFTINHKLYKLISNNEIQNILIKLEHINHWSKRDIQELKLYLDIKNDIIMNK